MEPLSRVYEPRSVETRWYDRWRTAGYFAPHDEPSRKGYAVVLPPPNVTGRLHMGHALTATIEDAMVRWHRMKGLAAVWLPGTDHAGIATQVMVERELRKQGTSRIELGREPFLERVWEWKNEHGGIIDKQHERLGASLDWDRYRFTMDEVSSRAVREAFCRLHEDGLIYRAYRLINWDWVSQTALSDLEVEHREVDGKLWHLRYPVEGGEHALVVATTRPETMLGDTAVAVHPDDPRYRELIGSHVVLPLTGRRIPIVGDPILVDMEFGTGAVKVTPAHDFNDFETGKRHDLEVLCVIGFDGRINDNAPESFRGLPVDDARAAVVDALDAAGALVEVEDYRTSIGFSQRNKDTAVEPLPSTQWFVKVAPLAEAALEAVRAKKTVFVPEHRTNDYYRWMENIHDWCISRQLWWGHRIPAWYCDACEHITVSRQDPQSCAECGSDRIRQDEDVLDTWFSSGLWPLTTLGWPEETDDLARFYPTTLMETGWDILFFWVARMMMFGLYFRGRVPFETVFLHSMVLGEDGHKMSKTKGNVVDPVELIDEFGADSLRFYLSTMAGQDAGIVFSRARVEGYRNFCNKIWNAARFTLMNIEGYDPQRFHSEVVEPGNLDALAIADRWILARSVDVMVEVNELLEQFRLDLAAHRLYQFIWYEVCDWYVELAKLSFRSEDGARRHAAQGTLVTVLDHSLRLLHPMIPYITEEIWTQLPKFEAEPSLMVADYPRVLERDASGRPRSASGSLPAVATLVSDPRVAQARKDVECLMDVVTSARSLRAQFKLPPSQSVPLQVRADAESAEMLGRILEGAIHLARLDSLEVLGLDDEAPRDAAADVVRGLEVFLPLSGLVDIDAERKRLDKDLAKLRKDIAGLERKLQNPKFRAKAPAEVVEKDERRLEELRETGAKLEQTIERLRD